MKAITLLVATISVVMGSSLFAGQKKRTVDAWLEQKYAQLAAVEEPASIRKVDLDESEEPDKDGYFSMHPKMGYLEFDDGSWVLLTSHSAHAGDGLPDISLIRTSSGEYFSNRGHCCLPILLFSKERVISLEGFLKATGRGAKAKSTPWIRYKRKKSGAEKPTAAPESTSDGVEKSRPGAEDRPR